MDNLITDNILLKNGFERNEIPVHKNIWSIENYRSYTLWLDDLKIDMMWKFTNNNADWHMHIDNDRCETIGSADINDVEQFNLMMKVFKSNFKLNV
jgi:hypothetical protein